MTFLLWVAGCIGVLIVMALIGFYAWFDDEGRYPIVEQYCDAVRIEKRAERKGNFYVVQGRVLGFWIDYKSMITDRYAREEAEVLLAIRNRLKTKSEVVEEYKL